MLAACSRIRTALLVSELRESSADLETSVRSARVEVEALHAGSEALTDSLEREVAEMGSGDDGPGDPPKPAFRA